MKICPSFFPPRLGRKRGKKSSPAICQMFYTVLPEKICKLRHKMFRFQNKKDFPHVSDRLFGKNFLIFLHLNTPIFNHRVLGDYRRWRYCNRVYWLKKLTGLGSESHWRKTASPFRRDATRPMPAAALFYNPPTLALPSSGRTTSRSSWGSCSVASFSPDGSWSQILGSV